MANLQDKIFSVTNDSFNQLALEVFQYQATYNSVYTRYLSLMGKHPSTVTAIEQIPFLPIELFKTQTVITGSAKPEITFRSSGTTGMEQSSHYVTNLSVYEKSFLLGFEHFYGSPANYCILALLPAYLEREGSSLVFMVERLIKESKNEHSGFYLNNLDELVKKLHLLEEQNQPTLLIGVSFALLDLAEKQSFNLQHTLIMETGGMKGRRKEITRSELHNILKERLGVKAIHSEYGMTELLSQGYSTGEGLFKCTPTMKVLVRDLNDPFQLLPAGQTGALNIIDLANINSCSFIATSDMGKLYDDGSFEVLGRMDNSDIRGCNLMI